MNTDLIQSLVNRRKYDSALKLNLSILYLAALPQRHWKLRFSEYTRFNINLVSSVPGSRAKILVVTHPYDIGNTWY